MHEVMALPFSVTDNIVELIKPHTCHLSCDRTFESNILGVVMLLCKLFLLLPCCAG
jgi:hypothetical protein